MRFKFSVLLLLILSVFIPFIEASAAKGDLAVRKEYGNLEDVDRDKNFDEIFNSQAIFEGKCSDLDKKFIDANKIMGLYRIEDKDGKEKLVEVGILYINDSGHESVCVDVLAVHPLHIKETIGEMVTIVGWITSGQYYGLKEEKIVVVESMERMGEN